MSDSPFTPPKKKPSIFWWLGGAFVVLFLLFLFQLFGPSPRVIVSPQTTNITGPLRGDGLPDYETHVLGLSRDGVTPENNAAALLWPALWPGELEPSQYAAIAAELGLDAIPSKADAVTPLDKRIDDWLRKQPPRPENADEAAGFSYQQSDEIFVRVTSRPWTSQEFPWLAKWVSENQKPLDKMVEASRRPRCYIPSPTMLDKQNDMLISTLLPGVQGLRESGRSLVARAMWHAGEQRPAEAWQDLLAIHRIGRLAAQGQTLVEQLVGISIDGIANQGTVALLDESRLSADEARQVQRDLEALPPFSGMADSMDNMERLSFLDTIVHVSRDDIDGQMLEWIGGDDSINYLRHFNINWNVALRKGNQWYDRYTAAARLPTFEARQQAFDQLDLDVQQLAQRIGVGTVVASVLNPTARSDAVASVMLSKFLPAVDAALTAQDRANSVLDLTRVAAALAVYRAEQGSYPDKLDQLVPGIIPKLPVDLFHSKPYVYQRAGDGYLLYTTGPNGQDDGGSNERMSTFEGIPLEDLDSGEAEAARKKMPPDADDYSIRVPRQPVKSLKSSESE